MLTGSRLSRRRAMPLPSQIRTDRRGHPIEESYAMATTARTSFVGLLAALCIVLIGQARPAQPASAPPPAPAERPARVVYLVGGLSDEALVSLGSAVAAKPDAVLLLDSRPLTPYL